jgi:tetratricopeptide (TPR) repeat protein
MPSHIAMRVGDYMQAAKDNEQAVNADKKVYAPACDHQDKQHCLPLYVGHYLGHNLFFWLAANQQLGRLENSKRIADELEQLTKEYVKGERGLEHYLSASVLALARFRQWKQVLEVPAPAEDLKMARAVWLWSRTMALGATEATQQELTAEYKKYHQAASAVPADLSWGNNKATAFFPLMDYLLSGHLAEHRGDRTEAITLFKLALNEQNRLIYDEPNPWSLNVRETLGGAYLRKKDFAMAQQVFKEDLDPQYNPGNGRSLFGLWKSLEGPCSQGQVRSAKAEFPKTAPADSCDPAKVQEAQAEFQKAWQFADKDVKLTIEEL